MTENPRSVVQAKAVSAVTKAFAYTDRGKVIMPCGSGKTRVGIQVMDRLQASLTLVLCPALSLVKQNLDCYLQNAKNCFTPLVVCSDDSTAKEARDQHRVACQTTTSPAEIRSAVRNRTDNLVIFATYQSVERIVSAFKPRGLQKVDLIVFDEAHRTAGTDGVFSLALHDKNIPARKRLFLTATPRTMRAALKQRAAEDGVEVVCMDDENLYGNEMYRLEFSEAVNLGLLTDYSVVIFGVNASLASEWMQDYGGEAIVAARVGLIKAMEKYKIRKVISYHSSTAAAKKLSGEIANGELDLPHLFSEMRKRKQVSGECWVRSIDGKTPVDKRNEIMQEFSGQPKTCRAVLSNCQVLTEGVDAPTVDAVAFMDPKSSVTDIVQAIGRCMRLCEGKHKSFVVVPVFIQESDEKAEDRPERWTQVLNVVRALRDHDSRIDAAIKLHRDRSEGDATEERASLLGSLPQISLDGIGEQLIGHLEPRLLGAKNYSGWTNEDIKKAVDEYIKKNRKRPTIDSTKTMQSVNAWLVYHRASSLHKWLSENGYESNVNYDGWNEDQIRQIVDDYVKETGQRPCTTSSRVFGRINDWFRHHCGTSLSKWLDNAGYPPLVKRSEFSEQQIKNEIDAYIQTHQKRPSSISSKRFTQIDSWLYLRLGLSLAKWMNQNGYPGGLRRDGWADEQIKSIVDSHIGEFGKKPTTRASSEFARIDGWLRKHRKSSLLNWLNANGY